MEVGFSSRHPASEFVFFVSEFLILLLSNHPLIIGISFICAFSFDLFLHRGKALKTLFALELPLLLFCAAFNSLFAHYGVTALFVLPGGNNFTLEALVYGIVFGAKLVIILIWFRCFNEIITAEKFIFLFSRFLPRTALVISMALRFIPLFKRQSSEIREARLGSLTPPKGLISGLKLGVRDASILVSWVLERGIDTANSMTARGYGSGRRSRCSPYLFKAADSAFIAFSIASIAAFFAFSSRFQCLYNPLIKIERLSFLGFVFAAAFAVLGLSPVLYTLFEKKRWKQ